MAVTFANMLLKQNIEEDFQENLSKKAKNVFGKKSRQNRHVIRKLSTP